MHFFDEEDIVTYEDLDCTITFYPETPTKIRQINRQRNYIARSWEKSKCFPSNDRYNCFIDKQHNSNTFLNLYSFWDMIPAALMSLNHTFDRSSMSNQYPQPTTHQPRTDSYPVFSSLRRMDSQRKDWVSTLNSFNEITYQTDDWTKQLLRLKSWVISGYPERWMEFRRLWWTVIVFKCSHLFHFFDFFCLLVQYFLFFFSKIYFFCSFWWRRVRSKTSAITSMYFNNPLGSRSFNLAIT